MPLPTGSNFSGATVELLTRGVAGGRIGGDASGGKAPHALDKKAKSASGAQRENIPFISFLGNYSTGAKNVNPFALESDHRQFGFTRPRFGCIIRLFVATSPSKSLTQILLADPDNTLTAAARRVLERRGLSVTIAADGDEALARFDPQTPVAIVSVTQPERDGLELVRELRARAPATQIILLTETSTISTAMMGLKEGAFAYIVKPIADYLQLTHAVEKAMELHELRASVDQQAASVPRQSPDLSTLNQLTEAILFAQPWDKVLKGAVKTAAHIFRASKAVVLLADKAGSLQLVAGLGNAGQGPTARDFLSTVGEAFAWQVAAERKILAVAGPDKRFVQVGAPMIARDKLVGVLIVYEIVPGEIDSARLTWLEAYAAQLGAAVELGRLEEENTRLSPIDPLTGAYSEGAFLDLAEREFRRSWRFNESLSVITVEIEGIAAILRRSRELHAHTLRTVSDICRKSVRKIDLVARAKDDSFMLLLLMTDEPAAQAVAERILHSVSAIPGEASRGTVRIAVRLGLTTYPHEGCASVMDLLEIARSALDNVNAPRQDLIGRA